MGNSLSNLEIVTHHPHSASSSNPSQQNKEVDDEEVERNWLKLPPNVMSLIFLKLRTNDILGRAQWVCSSWYKLSKQPRLFRSIYMKEIWDPCSHDVPLVRIKTLLHENSANISSINRYPWFMPLEEMLRAAVDRSCGKLLEISMTCFATDQLLFYICQKSESLRCLRLVDCYGVTKDGLTEMCKQFPQLEELELCGCSFSDDAIETIACLCPRLKSFRLNYSLSIGSHTVNGLALAIAEAMPELRHLNLFGNMLTDVGLRAILHGCPHLQTLDLRRCFNLKFEGDLNEMSANIKLRLPYESVH